MDNNMKTIKRSYQARYMEESDFRLGWDAAATYEDLDKSKSEVWIEGWEAYWDEMDSHDQKSW